MDWDFFFIHTFNYITDKLQWKWFHIKKISLCSLPNNNKPNLHANPIFFDPNHLITVFISDNDDANFIDPSIFTIEFSFYHYKTNKTGSYELFSLEKLDLHPCNKEDLKSNPHLFETFGLKNALCLENNSFFLEGY